MGKFGPVQQNTPVTHDDFIKDGCNSVHDETGERCGCKEGHQMMSGPPGFVVVSCSRCGISNTIYKDKETMDKHLADGHGPSGDGAFSFSLKKD